MRYTKIGSCAAIGLLAAAAFPQPKPPAVPLADNVDKPLFPAGIWNHPLTANAQLAYIFTDEAGTDVVQLTGEVTFTLGSEEKQILRSREAVVWITPRTHEGRHYHHLQILLWQEGVIEEFGGTVTTGPALFVTVNTFGELRLETDDVAFGPPMHRQIYEQGARIRAAVKQGATLGPEAPASTRVFDAAGLTRPADRPRPRPVIHFQTGGELKLRTMRDGTRVLTATGSVQLARAEPGTEDFFQVQADSVVVFLSGEAGLQPGAGAREPQAGLGPEPDESAGPAHVERQPADRTPDPDRQLLASTLGDVEVESAYLEGDVIMSQGVNRIRASRLYYDFRRERAIILDAVVRTLLVKRNIPLYVRAEQIRQLSQREFVANDAMLTTSEFYTPHYHIGAERVELINRTPPDPTGRTSGIRAGSFAIRHATLNVADVPVFYWPYIRGSVDTSETAIKSLRTGFSDDFGLELETQWHLFNVLGYETPEGFDATLSLDYYSERGPAGGVDVDYKRDRYFGLIRSYALWDDGEDNLGRDRVTPPSRGERGRFLLRHRQYLEEDWQLSLEVSYISDDTFLEEYFESEFDNDKEQETLLYLKKQRDNWAFTALLQPRILDFTTQTERFPDLSFHLAGQPLPMGERSASFFSENRLGIVRYRPADQDFFDLFREGARDGSGSVARADTRQELDMPIDIGPWRFVPFVSGRGTAWDDTPGSGGAGRIFGTLGVRGSSYLSRVYRDSRSELFDIDGIRHVIKSDIVAWVASSNRDPHELFPFDSGVEEIAEVDGVTFGVRQRWQTKRGRGNYRRTVDLLTWDIDVGAFNDAEGRAITNGFTSFSRPENSIARSFVNSSLIWRLNDRTALLSEMNYDLNDGEMDIFNLSMAVERPPRFSYILGYRFIEESDSNLLGFDMNYRLTEKHTLAIREALDLERGRTLDFTIALIRKFPRWFGALSFALDEPEDDFGVSVSIWPEGLPQAALGSRRFTGLATTTSVTTP